MLLSIISNGKLHGYAVIEQLRVRSGGELDLPTGTVYPALRRLERAGHLKAQWSEVDGRRRRIYELTGKGRSALADRRDNWHLLTEVMAQIVGEVT